MNPAPSWSNLLWFGSLIQALDERPMDGVLIETDPCGASGQAGNRDTTTGQARTGRRAGVLIKPCPGCSQMAAAHTKI